MSPAQCNPDIKLKKKPTEYLQQIYFDALIFTPEALRHLVAEVGASQIMLGSDHPFPWEEHPVDHIFATTTLSDDEKIAILGGNAARLFGIKILTVRDEISMADEPRPCHAPRKRGIQYSQSQLRYTGRDYWIVRLRGR